jgi:two-component sensor histidine kinase
MEGPYVALRVDDDGPGLPASLEAGNTESLGMTLVRSLADQLSGSVAWESGGARTGVRATFRFPLEEPQA